MYSLIIPVYGNEGSIPELFEALETLTRDLTQKLEVVFVIDASPDQSLARIRERLPNAHFDSQLVVFARNFGSFTAIREGLRVARGEYLAMMAADLQEPPSLAKQIFETLETKPIDVVSCTRSGRADPWSQRLTSGLFWWFYRKFVQPDVPAGGVDVFGIHRRMVNYLLNFHEANSTLIGQLYWIGGRRAEIPYVRQARQHGKSGWTFKKRWKYMTDSIYAFSDLPVRLMTRIGVFGIVFSAIFAALVVAAKLLGGIPVPGYAMTVLVIVFFSALNLLGLGIIGTYVWRTFENTKQRPQSVVLFSEVIDKKA